MSTKDRMNDRNLIVEILEGDNVDIFYNHLENACKNNKRRCFLTNYDRDYYKQTKMIVLENGCAVGAVDQYGEIISVINNKTLAKELGVDNSGLSTYLIMLGVKMGGVKLDCFDSFLGNLYCGHGFIPAAKMKFDPQQSPDWPKDIPPPEYIYSFFLGQRDFDKSLEAIDEKTHCTMSEMFSALPEFYGEDGYEKMNKFRDFCLEYSKQGDLSYEECVEAMKNGDFMSAFNQQTKGEDD